MKDGAVLGDDSVHEVQVAGDPTELAQDTSGHEQDDDASRPGIRNGVAHRWIETIALGDRAVVVESDD
jgi:hypothetical protein